MELGKNRVGSKWKRGRERKREAGHGRERERQSLGENQKQRGLINDRWKRHLRISNK
jgi:hypothetical protein